VHVKEAAAWVAVWVSLALAFAGLLWWYLNDTQGAEVARTKTLEFLAGYLIEQSLSVDNMFVFVMIFSYFAVPPELQRRVLLYGVLGAIVMRAGMIFAGVWLVQQFAWILYVFGAFLVVTGIKMIIFAERNPTSKRTRCCAGCAGTCASRRSSTARSSSCARTASSGRRRCSSCWC
jgi:tellurite resistance protein TerC